MITLTYTTKRGAGVLIPITGWTPERVQAKLQSLYRQRIESEVRVNGTIDGGTYNDSDGRWQWWFCASTFAQEPTP